MTTKDQCFNCGIFGHFAKECSDCANMSDLDKTLKYIDTFISNKRKLEEIPKKFVDNKSGYSYEPDPNMKGWYKVIQVNGISYSSGPLPRPFVEEQEKAKKQKEKNEEYLPLFEAFQKALKMMNNKK
jgi:hypothetical protein